MVSEKFFRPENRTDEIIMLIALRMSRRCVSCFCRRCRFWCFGEKPLKTLGFLGVENRVENVNNSL